MTTTIDGVTWYGVADVARTTGLTPQGVRKAVARGTLVPEARGVRPYRFREAEVLRYLKDHRRAVRKDMLAYRYVAAELGRGRTIQELVPSVVGEAAGYALRRRRRWPPKPVTA